MARRCNFVLKRTADQIDRCGAPSEQKADQRWLCDRHHHTVTVGHVPVDIAERDTFFDTLPGYEKMVYGHGVARGPA